jgi:Lipid A 3-O-deacylase (PagL)
VVGELTIRHWSNGGIKLPNHGQDFATFTVRLNSGLFGLGDQEHYAINPSFALDRSLAAGTAGFQGEPLP